MSANLLSRKDPSKASNYKLIKLKELLMNIKQIVRQSNEYRNWKESRSEEKIEWAFGFVFTILMVGLLILIMQ